MDKAKIIIIFLLFFSCYLKAQYTVKGVVTDEELTAIPFANVQLINSKGKLVTYGITKSDGTFVLIYDKEGSYNLKITHISHRPTEVEIIFNESNKRVSKKVVLDKNAESLDEIVLKVDPKILEIDTDTITYNLKRLTDGTESNLAQVLDKLPGVKLNSAGLITVNGKQVNKLLIDGEELFKQQHRITTQSITSEMIEGIRYLDKYKDFGNIKDFNNKEVRALDVSIKDKFKNKITGDLLAQGGVKNKLLGHTNLYRFGGKVKIGFISDANNLGVPSITSSEYSRLVSPSNDYNVNKKGFNLLTTPTPSFLKESNDIARRDNYFGALSMVYKPSERLKLSILKIGNYTEQEQQFLLTRQFFNDQNTLQQETRSTNSNFLLSTSNVELGYQANDNNFFSYNISFTPRGYSDDLSITSLIENNKSDINQTSSLNGYLINNNFNYTGTLSKRTLLGLTGVFTKNTSDNALMIDSSNPFLGLSFLDKNRINQFIDLDESRFGFELTTSSKLSKGIKLETYSGVFQSKDNYRLSEKENNFFNDLVITNRTDSYIGFKFNGKISQKNRIRSGIEYRYLSFNRLNDNFEKKFILPEIYFEHTFKATRRFNIGYSYDVSLPQSIAINQSTIASTYFSQISNSNISIDKVFPVHQLNTSFFNLNSSTGSTLLVFGNYTFSPEFFTSNSFFDDNNISTIQYDVGRNRYQGSLGFNIDGRIKILKLKVYANTLGGYSEEENKINFEDNLTKSIFFQESLGMYSRFRTGLNFSAGVKFELYNYKNSVNDFETTASSIKPSFSLNGSLLDKRLVWILSSSYEIYQTELSKTEFLNIKPNIRYKITDNWELRIIGDNILNINNSEIAENINNINFSENRISQTLEGYLTLGVYYLLK